MLLALSWIVVVVLLVLWTLGAWATHAAVGWAAVNAGSLGGIGLDGLGLPQWVLAWLAPELVQALTTLLAGLATAGEGLLQSLPALAGGLGVAVWVLWAVGALLLVTLGAAAHLLAVAVRRGVARPARAGHPTDAARRREQPT